ncbi:gliding motility protein RemB [Owenweeksia hongkongensis]|uniref:gliding motility protein RemB n=1 Tax=Owenweeksia hongkongensis TaxID=253245 RepID=UPI003A91756F
MTRIVTVFLLLVNGVAAFGQYQYQRFNHVQDARYNGILYDKDVNLHTSVRPLDLWELDSNNYVGSVQSKKSKSYGWLRRKAFHEHLFNLEGDNYWVTIDPIVNFQGGVLNDPSGVGYVNTRGFNVEGRLGEKVTFKSSYLENQAVFPQYISDFVEYRKVVPGQGHARDFGDNGYDFGIPSGEVTFTPDDIFSFTVGQGRNFFGEGYRSMFLSDAGFNYPFLRIETTFGPVKYTNLWAQMYDVRPEVSPGNNFAKKYLSSHYLSININSRLNVSFFEAIVMGDTAQVEGIDASFFNPIIFYRPVEYAVGSGTGNALLGAASSYKLFDGIQAYGQFVLDEFSISDLTARNGSWVNKFGWQLGIKGYDFIIPGLFTRLEYNAARPYTYSHREVLTNYAHYGQPLAHPWGANFQEGIVQLIYTHKRWEAEVRFHYGVMGLDGAGEDWGMDVYKSYNERQQDLDNTVGQGQTSAYTYLRLRGAWLVNPASGLKVEAGMNLRNLRQDVTTTPFSSGEFSYYFVGLRTEFFNSYYDF